MVKAPRSLAPEFVLSLVPIALVYAIAHYFSLFVIQGQYMIPLLSDPFGKGWDLFGTAGFHPNIAVLDAEHDLVRPGRRRSCSGTSPASPSPTTGRSRSSATAQDALRSQYAMLALMVLYTVGGLWLLSRTVNVLAHGGTPGLIAELAIGLLVGGCWQGSGSGSGAGGPGASVGPRLRCAIGRTKPP